MRTATKQDFKAGISLFDPMEPKTEIKILNKYDDGIWEARIFYSDRVVGDKCVFEREAKFYFIKE